MTPLALEVRNITKKYPGVIANDHVNFQLRKGTIHALLGENGAGKSTLMNIIYGLAKPDEGKILIDGVATQISSPNDAIHQGIGMVHQHFMLVPVFSVVENIMLGAETTKWMGLGLDKEGSAEKIRQLSQKFNLSVDPDAIVENLPIGLQQRVEIVKALYRSAKVLVLDEPTAVLTPQEADDLFIVMRQLTKQGVSIIFITHKLREVLAVADDITVMRRGKVVGTAVPNESTEAKLAEMMVGREVIFRIDKALSQPKEVILSVRDLVVREHGVPIVKNVSFEVRGGEVLGIAGVQGNGQTQLAEVITGLRSADAGTVLLDNVPIKMGDPRYLVEHGLAHIPEDRQKHGLVMSYPISDNMVLNTYYRPPFAKGIRRQAQAVWDSANQLIKKFDVRTPNAEVKASSLSGGNQQKVIVARELNRPIRLLIANQPTRGLDVGSIEFIHHQIIDQRNQGIAVLLVSAELDELFSLADRIAVMFDGKIVGVLPVAEATHENMGLMMTGSLTLN